MVYQPRRYLVQLPPHRSYGGSTPPCRQAQQLKDIFEKFDSNAWRMASQFALGMNPDCRIIPDTKEVSKRLGTLHVAMGDNISLGGTIQSDLHIDFILLNPTVWLDGKLILENGKLFI